MAGILFVDTQSKSVLAGFHPKLNRLSGFGGKSQGEESAAQTAVREVSEELFGVFNLAPEHINAFAEELYKLGKKDATICIVVADISPAGSVTKFREEFPHRFINTGVAEQSMIGIAAGLASQGLKPFCYTIATFSLFRPFEMIRVDLCYQKLPVTVVGMGAGVVYSTLGGTHHAIEDIAVACALPNMTVLAPCDPLEVSSLTKWCAENNNGPVYLRIGKSGEPNFTEDALEPLVQGKLRYLKKGKDTAIISYGTSMKIAMEVYDCLNGEKLSVSLLSCHTLKPLDEIGIQEVLEKYKRVIVIEEAVSHGGLGSKVKEIAWNSRSLSTVETFSLKDEFIHLYGSYEDLLSAHELLSAQILTKLK